MKLTLSENIRLFRRQRKITQEKLAEVLGVTVGAIYKWESGRCLPELGMIVDMADFFDVSVDVLLGYKVKDNRLEATVERLTKNLSALDPSALAEAERALGKYPHSFKIVYSCAQVYFVFGYYRCDRDLMHRALDLMEQAEVLLPQNDDPRINEATISGNMSLIRLRLGEYEKSLDLLKKNNAGGIFDDRIGAWLSIFMDRPEEAVPYLSQALLSGLSILLTTIVSYVFLYRARKDWNQALAITNWGLDILGGLKSRAGSDVLDKVHAELLALLAYIQKKAGMPKEAAVSIQSAADLSSRFDSKPDYGLDTMRFIEQGESSAVFDVFGTAASGSVESLLELLGDEGLSKQWKEMNDG